MKPKWLKCNWACPDCGLVIDGDCDGDCSESNGFNCSRCKVHYTLEEFLDLNVDKWQQTKVEEEEL